MPEAEIALVEFANDAFYSAFNTRNFEQMCNLWSDLEASTCIHPGWQPLMGRKLILNSWKQIFENQPSNFVITHHIIKTQTQGSLFSILCYEELADVWMVATNNYMFEKDHVRMVHHQASPCNPAKDMILSNPSVQ